MKILTLTLSIALFFVGCDKPSVFVDQLGEHEIEGPFQKVIIRPNSLSVVLPKTEELKELENVTGREFASSVGPSDWTNHAGFFVHVGEKGEVFAYDGESSVWSLEPRDEGSVSYRLDSSSKKLPEIIRSKIRDRKKQNKPIEEQPIQPLRD